MKSFDPPQEKAAPDQPYDTLRVRMEADVHVLQIHRPQAGNAINARLVQELGTALRECERHAKIVVLEGLPEVFCTGGDFNEIREGLDENRSVQQDPGPLFDLWTRLAHGPFVSVAHVRGRVNAGGVGFVAACDIVLSDSAATFALSELLFGLMPACVLPFLSRRIGFSRANYLALSTQPLPAAQALAWGLVDACENPSEQLLRKQLLRLRRLDRQAIARYKRYAHSLDPLLDNSREKALAANREVFSNPDNLEKIARYMRTGKFPWEND